MEWSEPTPERPPEPDPAVVARVTAAVRQADRAFKATGGTSRHYVQDCLLPALAEHGVRVSLSG